MSPKAKVQIAREHLTKARSEATAGDLRNALQWAFASLEAAIDALAAPRGLAIDQKHSKRTEAATSLHADGVLRKDLAALHRFLNRLRKAVFYDGEEPELDEDTLGDLLTDIEDAVRVAEAEVS